MLNRKMIVSMMATGGMILASQQAGATIVGTGTDLDLINVGGLDATGHFEGAGGYIYEAIADSDANQFAAIGVSDGAGFAGLARGLDAGAFGALSTGSVIRMSAWFMSNPNDPITNVGGEDGMRFELLNALEGDGNPGSPDLIFATPLSPVTTAPISTTGWTQKSLTLELDSVTHDLANLLEIRPVIVQSGGPGATGELFVDNLYVEVFSDLATATGTTLPGSPPGGFDVPVPIDLSGDINGDGFVGIDDLNIILGQWNVSAPPPVPGPVLSDFSNFNLSGTYVDWDTATITSGATDFRVEATNLGGGWFDFASPLDISGATVLEIDVDINAANLADEFNVVLIDADGTERVLRYTAVTIGDDQTLSVNLADFLQDNAPGTVPGLDLENIITFHLQGTFADADALDITFDELRVLTTTILEGDINNDGFIGIDDLNAVLSTWNNGTPPVPAAAVPEPATLALLSIGGFAMLRRRSA